MGEAIVGQRAVIDRLPIGLLANGNLLLEGLPGLAETRAMKALAKNLECEQVPALRFPFFRRIGEKGVGPGGIPTNLGRRSDGLRRPDLAAGGNCNSIFWNRLIERKILWGYPRVGPCFHGRNWCAPRPKESGNPPGDALERARREELPMRGRESMRGKVPGLLVDNQR